jgi:hypothetical protein
MTQKDDSPLSVLCKTVTIITNHPRIVKILELNGSAYTQDGYFCWQVEHDGEEVIFYAVNPKLEQVYELEFEGQDPTNGIAISQDEDLIWLILDLGDFVQAREEREYLFPTPYVFPPEARYIFGATYGSLHSLS